MHLSVVPRYNDRRAFSVADPMTWNSLADSLHDPSLSDTDKRFTPATVLLIKRGHHEAVLVSWRKLEN